MRNTIFATSTLAFLLGLVMLLPSCGMLSAWSQAARDSRAVQQRSEELDKKLDQLKQTLDSYGPLAETLGPDIKEGYKQVQREYEKARDYLADAQELHQKSMAKATDPKTGDTDWMKYLAGLLGGGGLLYNERRKTAKERDQLHARVDHKSAKVKELQELVKQIQHTMELEAARRAQPPA